MVLLHRLEQRRLRLRRRAVDLVGKDDLREDRPLHEPQAAVPAVFVEDLGPGDVGGHQIGGELNPLERQIEDLGERLDQQRLRQPRDTSDEAVAAGEQRDQDLIDDGVLPDDDFPDLGKDAFAPGRDALGDGGGGGGHH